MEPFCVFFVQLFFLHLKTSPLLLLLVKLRLFVAVKL